MDFKLNEVQEAMQKQAKDFAEKYLAGRVEELESADNFPKEIHDKMAEVGFTGLTFSEKYGGMEVGYDSFSLVVEQIAKVSGSTAKALLIDVLPLEAINLFGTEAQKQKYLREGIAGKTRGSFAFTEPGTGSDPKQLVTVAKKKGGQYVISGTKRFISNSAYEGPIVLFARDEGADTCTAFIFDKFCKGYSISTHWEKIGMTGSAVYDIFLDGVTVDESQILGKAGDGYNILLATTAFGKLGFSASFVGVMGGAYDAAVKYVKEKMHRGQSIMKFQAIQLKTANLAAKVESARYFLYKTSEDANNAHADMKKYQAQSALLKGYISDLGVECCVLAMNLMGSYGVMKEYNVERCLRDSLIGPHIEGASDIQRIIAGNYLLRN
ncbi:MAG: acyl-CoA dehydrogenase family protein [Acidaminococcales bacterium]|jgi:alkylation response protein AidB-like acyl-CoA dehydrogenase|nr:acyl-CoA dehydrogenase family protein [Acidaminococcales bacterium]